jgi:hypothetical protein
MGSFSAYLEKKLLDHFLKVAAYTQPTNLYIGLSTAAIEDDNSGATPPVGNGYARAAANSWAASTSTGGPPTTQSGSSNSAQIIFPTATGAWGTITHFGMYDAITGGNLMGWGALAVSKVISTGDTPRFDIGQLTVTLS